MTYGLRFPLALTILTLTTAAGQPPSVPVEERAVLSGKIQADPARGYIYLHASNRFFATFLRVPDDAQRTEYAKEWEEAFAKEQARYPARLRAWESAAKSAKATSTTVPKKPIEPTREAFSIRPMEYENMVSVGPMFVYKKADKYFGYLTSVPAGTYIYYGNMIMAEGGGFVGSCYCMGSVKFEVRPGVVTDLGNFLTAAPARDRAHDAGTIELWRTLDAKAAKSGKPADWPLPAETLSYGPPDTLKTWQWAQAEFSASGKVNNFHGVTITRLPQIPGVLAYRRDSVIDARKNSEIPDPSLVSRDHLRR